MRTIVVLGVTLLVALSSAAGEETKKPDTIRLKLICTLAKDGLTILPAEPEPATKDSTLLIITCDSMRLGSDGSIVVENVTIEMKEGTLSAKEAAICLDDGSFTIKSPNSLGLRDVRFVKKPTAQQPK